MKKEIDELKNRYNAFENDIKSRLRQFSNLASEEYFYELCFCLLTPQSNAEKCWQAVEKLKECRFQGNKTELCLRQNTRFYRNKAGYIKEAIRKWPEIKERVMRIKDVTELRNWLAENVKGLGYKEASHFLRNIGKSNDKIAILDRHIIRNLKGYGVIKEIPKSLTKKVYLDIESKIRIFSERIGIPLDELDLLLWAKETGKVFK